MAALSGNVLQHANVKLGWDNAKLAVGKTVKAVGDLRIIMKAVPKNLFGDGARLLIATVIVFGMKDLKAQAHNAINGMIFTACKVAEVLVEV